MRTSYRVAVVVAILPVLMRLTHYQNGAPPQDMTLAGGMLATMHLPGPEIQLIKSNGRVLLPGRRPHPRRVSPSRYCEIRRRILFAMSWKTPSRSPAVGANAASPIGCVLSKALLAGSLAICCRNASLILLPSPIE